MARLRFKPQKIVSILRIAENQLAQGLQLKHICLGLDH